MRSGFILLALLAALAPPPQQAQQDAPAGIRGIVVDAASNQPVAGAVVELTVPLIGKGKVERYSTTSRANGTFELKDLKPASGYQLVVTEDDHQPGAFGQRSEYDPWTPINLAAGQQMTDVRIVLTPISSISGKVLDSSGKPLSGADVTILRATYNDSGARILQQAGFPTLTGEKGDYFYGGLTAGQYYVRVSPQNAADYRELFRNPVRWDKSPTKKLGEPEGYPTVYYPSALEPANASPINLLNGGKVQNIIVVAPKVRTRRVRGTVAFQSGTQNSESRLLSGINVLLVPRNAGDESTLTRKLLSRDGQFDFRGVFPGSYKLMAFTSDNLTQYTGQESLEIGDSDIANASVTLAAGTEISGTIQFEEWIQVNPPDYSQFAIAIIPDARNPIDKSADGVQFAKPRLLATPSANGDFTFQKVVPGDYSLVLTMNPKLARDARIPMDLRAAYMKSAKIGSADVLNSGVHIKANNEKLQIVISTSSGSIYGRVIENDQETAVPSRMMIIPDKPMRNRVDLYVPVSVSPTGRFSVVGVPPGDYKLFAWSHVENGAWLDPEFIKVYEDRGVPVHIEAEASVGVEVKLIH